MADRYRTGGGAPSDPDGPSGRLAHWLAATTLADIPPDVRSRARHLTLDGIGCLLVGARLPWSAIAVRALVGAEPGSSLIAGWARSASPSTAVLLNSSFIQGFELDDFSYRIPWHSNSVLLPTVLAVVGMRPAVTGADLLRAAILGCETGCRAGLALHGPELTARGWHSGVVFGGIGAAAAAGVLYGFTPARFEDALGIAATQSSGLMAAQYESMVKRMQHGFAARNGFVAALLAASGYVGVKRVFERPYGGFLAVYGEGHHPDVACVDAALGDRWYSAERTVKPYAAMGYTHPAIEAALALRKDEQLKARDVTRVTIEVAEGVLGHTAFAVRRPLDSTVAQMSVTYSTAVALVDGAASMEQFRPDRVDRDDVWRLIELTRVSGDGRPSGSANRARLRVLTRDGRAYERCVDRPLGSPERPLTDAQIIEKYRELTGRVVDRRRQRAIEELVLRLDERPDAPRELLDLLAPAVGDPFA
ncbi:MmgE/PrpD family protein [Micromonospora sp. MS34]|uniref:MmgE/PrpD family protein n=1 Tax=Micromonospora sp. MS34 TaxID=3385971 RepID=UPI0039A3A8E1